MVMFQTAVLLATFVSIASVTVAPLQHPLAAKTLPLRHPLRRASSSYTGYLAGRGMRKNELSTLLPTQSANAQVDSSDSNVAAAGRHVSKKVLACVGDSSAFALGLKLQRELGPQWDVQLYWEGCASAFLTPQHDTPCGGQPFRQTVGFQSAILSAATYVVVLLGTSDASRSNSEDFDVQGFVWGYQNLVMDFQRMPTSPQVVLMSPPPLYPAGNLTGNPNTTIVNEIYPRIFPQIANSTGAVYLDGFSACGGLALSCPTCISQSGQLSNVGACRLAVLFEDAVPGVSSLGHCARNITTAASNTSNTSTQET